MPMVPDERPLGSDLLCFSHLRWDFVFQRPNHLMSRFARTRRVFFVEEPLVGSAVPTMDVTMPMAGLYRCVPGLPEGLDATRAEHLQRRLLADLVAAYSIEPSVLWFFTPLALPLAAELTPEVVVYDCMDELSAFHAAAATLAEREEELFTRADLVFTGGHSLWQAKRLRHPRVHCYPSSVDVTHFATGADPLPEPADQVSIPHPRLGFFGVIDERMDLELVARIAGARPDWHLVMVGPLAKIPESSLPDAPNLHWFGQKSYDELPSYLSGWDVALMPFALNDATRFISPSKTLEYLAGGKPVVATPIADVVRPYGEIGLVDVATGDAFVDAIAAALARDRGAHAAMARLFLEQTSWEATWACMDALVTDVLACGATKTAPNRGNTPGWRA